MEEQIILGTFRLGNESVEVVARTGTGGEFYSAEAPARVKVGMGYGAFEDCMAVLLHESFELSMDRQSCRHYPSNDWGHDHSSYIFVFNHPQFSDFANKTACFLEEARPHLLAAWELLKEVDG